MSPPPEAQLSLKGRVLFGISVPLSASALAAAAGVPKSTKQYPAFLKSFVSKIYNDKRKKRLLPRKFVAYHFNTNSLSHVVPDVTNEIFVDPRLKFTHPEMHHVNTTSQIISKREDTYQRVVFASFPEPPF